MAWRRYLPTHDESGAYRGPLSTFQEYHALGLGVFYSLRSPYPYHRGIPDHADAQAEPATYAVGWLLGTAAQAAVLIAVGAPHLP